MTQRDSALDRALEYAIERGTKDGTNAAGWYVQEFNKGADPSPTLRGIEAGDPETFDNFPTADLSGQYADTLNAPRLVDDARYLAGLQHDERHDLYAESYRESCEACRFMAESFNDICDAYELAFNDAVVAEIERAARYHLGVEA